MARIFSALVFGSLLTFSACTTSAPESTPAEAGVTTAPQVATTSPATAPTTGETSSVPPLDGVEVDVSDCELESPANFPDAEQFILVPEDAVFRCFGIRSYGFIGSQVRDSDDPEIPTAVAIESSATLNEGEPRYVSSVVVDGDQYLATRIDDLISVTNPGGTVEKYSANNAFAILELPSTRGQIALAGAGFTVVELYGGGAVQVGSDTLNGRTALRWEAPAQEISNYVNESGFVPLPVQVADGFVHIWTDENGFVVKIKAEIFSEDVTIGGSAVADLDADTSGFFFGTYEFEYVDFDEPVTIVG